MDAKERLELIRSKLGRAKSPTVQPSGLFAAKQPNPGNRVPKVGYKRRTDRRAYHAPFGVILPGRTAHMMDWIYEPAKQAAERPEPPRRGQHHLTKIAEKWLHKPKH